MAITNPTKYVTVRRLERYKQKLADHFADKAIGATSGNLAEFDSNGNPVDSGKTLNYTSVQTAEDIIGELI